MFKVIKENSNIKEEIIIDPYIPIKIKFGHFYTWEDPTHFIRYGDFKTTLLEVGYSAESGTIQSIALISTKDIFFNKVKNFTTEQCEDGLIVFDVEKFQDKLSIEVSSEVIVSTWDNNIVLSFSDDYVVKFIQHGKVKFGLNQYDELCCFVVSGLTEKEMKKLNGCLEYMLECCVVEV